MMAQVSGVDEGQAHEILTGAFGQVEEALAQNVQMNRRILCEPDTVGRQPDLQTLAPWRKLVTADLVETRRIEPELLFRRPGDDYLPDEVLGHGVGVTLPGYESFGRGHLVGDLAGVVRPGGQGKQGVPLLFPQVYRPAPRRSMYADVCSLSQPNPGLGVQILDVVEAPSTQEIALHVPEGAFDLSLGPGTSWAAGLGPEAVVGREQEKTWIVDWNVRFPTKHDGLHVVVQAGGRAAAESLECLDMPLHLGLLSRCGLEANDRLDGFLTQPSNLFLDDRVSSVIALLAKLFEDTNGADARILVEQPVDDREPSVDLSRAPLSWSPCRRTFTAVLPAAKELPYRVAGDAEFAGDSTLRPVAGTVQVNYGVGDVASPLLLRPCDCLLQADSSRGVNNRTIRSSRWSQGSSSSPSLTASGKSVSR